VVGELYDYPGGFLTQDRGDHAVTTRLNEEQSSYEVVRAAGNTRGVGVGSIFSLIEAPFTDAKAAHLVVRAQYELRGHLPESGSDEPENDSFRCSLTLLSSREPFRPTRQTPRPVVQGPQTATVVGPKKNAAHEAELWTDDWGRVLLRFHWERLGADKPDDPSRAHDEDANDDTDRACWVRVASAWAGKHWGFQFTPRIGDEVIVEFLDGDPDRPIVTGRVYNNVNRPPYPNAKNTQSGIKTHSTPGGGPDNFNELRFDDKRGSEELYVRAERDHRVLVKADRTLTVGGKDTTDVKLNRTTTVHEDDQLTVAGNNTATVKKAFTLETGVRFALIQGGQGGRPGTAGVAGATGGTNSITGEGNEIAINGPTSVTLSSAVQITLRVGATSITLKHDQIEVKADTVKIVGQAQTDIMGGGASAKLHGAVDVSGTMVNLNG
jgi:type VI secretion system secreted protein VgrG